MKENRCEVWQYLFPANKQFIMFQILLNVGTNSAGNSLENVAKGTTIKTFQTLLNFSEIRKLNIVF